jgi:hypothetical protein
VGRLDLDTFFGLSHNPEVPPALPTDGGGSDGSVADQSMSSAPQASPPGGYLALTTVVSACVVPLLYLVFVDHFATNVFQDDDWTVVPFVHAALHGKLTADQLWQQHNESRLLVGNLVMVVFGSFDRLDLRSIILFSAVVFVASYFFLLIAYRRYLGGRLTPLSVLVIGALWFSLADVQNALWAFQVSWYLTIFFLMVMLAALLAPRERQWWWIAIAGLAAAAASLSTVQGLACWPLGALCLLWSDPRGRRDRMQAVTWIGSGCLLAVVYFVGYSTADGNTCLLRSQCTPSGIAHAPLTAIEFVLALMGNVIPGPIGTTGVTIHDPARFVVLGVALLAVAVFIGVQSFRFRTSKERVPLPLILILFSLCFDLLVAAGRAGTGIVGAVGYNRYVMPNLLLVVAIVVYGWPRIPTRRQLATNRSRSAYVTYAALGALGVFVIVQVVTATSFGITNARITTTGRNSTARYVVNLYLPCEEFVDRTSQPFLVEPDSVLQEASKDHLGEFGSSSYSAYRKEGLTPTEVRVVEETLAAARRSDPRSDIQMSACVRPPPHRP